MIGILGGVFDPIHIGHLRMAIDACQKYPLEQVCFIPCKKPVDKKAPMGLPKHRLAMLKLALKPHKNFSVDTVELDRKSPSYMIETVRYLKEKFPRKKLGLIMGADRIETFHLWRDYKEILANAELILMPRDLPVSSTKIRYLIQSNKQANYLLPEVVLQYIKKHHLYSARGKTKTCQ